MTRFLDQLRSLDVVLDRLLSRFAVGLLGDDGAPVPVTRMRTGVAELDALLGGGFACGRIAELFGPPGCGKTTLALALVAAAQRESRVCAWIDAENALDPVRAHALGVDLGTLVAARPRTGEQAIEMMDALLRHHAVSFVVVDSVAALLPQAELDAPVGGAPRGVHARMMSAGLRRLAASLAASGAVALFLNQERTGFDERGHPFATTSGGHALHFYAATRLGVVRLAEGVCGVSVRKGAGAAEGARAQVALAPRLPSVSRSGARIPAAPHSNAPARLA
jgi:recombination protein RecA